MPFWEQRWETKFEKHQQISEVSLLIVPNSPCRDHLVIYVSPVSEILPSKATNISRNPSKKPELPAQDPVRSQQQTIVYVTKDLGMPPQNPVP